MRAVNLIPAEQREGAGSLTGRSEGAALVVLLLIAGLALMAVLYGKARHAESASRAELKTVNAELVATRALVGRMAPYTTFISMANQRVQTFSQLVASRFDWSHAFNELGRVLPHDAALTSLTGQAGAETGGPGASAKAAIASATPTSATPPGSTPTFTITGCATTQSEVAQTLQRLRLIDGVSQVTLQSSVKPGGSSGSSAGSAASSGGACGPHAPNFSAQIAFTALPAAPLTNTPGAAPATSASAAAPGGAGTVSVSNQGGPAK